MKVWKLIFSIYASIFLLCACESKSELSEIGNYFDNINEFYYTLDVDNSNELTLEYMKNIEYKIIDFDKSTMVASLEVSVPNIESIMSDTCDKLIRENKYRSYEELFSEVKATVLLGIKDCPKTTEIISMEVFSTDQKEFFLVQNDEWYNITTGNLLSNYTDLITEYIKENTK